MAKKRGKRRAAVKRAAHHVRRRVGAAVSSKPGKLIMAAGVAAAGGVATSYAINNIPKVKDMSATAKSLMQIGAGAVAVFFLRKNLLKALGAGAVTAGIFGLTKATLNVNPLAGPSAGGNTLPPEVMRRLINRGMSVPASVRMQIPASVAMRGSSVMSRRPGGWNGVSFG